MLKYIVIALFVAVAWALCWWLELPLWIAWVVTGVAVALVATIVIVKIVRARRASREIEKALKAQAEKQARAARPDLEADIRALQGEFNKAVNALKSSRLGNRGAQSALYSLPWYVIVGPPGVGKSTALRNSGLNFPFMSARGGASVKGVGGTRNCEWWMTSEAVILDTAGRYTTEDSDREEWFAFLDLLKKFRTGRPINGVLAAVSVADLAEAHPDEVTQLAREIRSRTDELQDRLGVVVPVYLVFTKCDLLPGFVEMFADLKEAERHQMWGFTMTALDQHDLVGRFLDYYDELTSVIEKRVLRRVAEERRGEGRDRIYELPQYIAGLRDSMARFVGAMMQENIYHETPILRGVYLSSGTQEGRPINRIMNAIAEGFGINPAITRTAGPTVEAKSYFLGELFQKVIFPDYKLTRPNRHRVRRQKVASIVAGAALLVASVGIAWLPMRSFEQNRRLVREGNAALANVEAHIAEDSVDAIAVARIEPLRALIATLATYETDGAPWSMRLGMYQGKVIYPRLRDLYAATVRKELLLPIVERELAELERFVGRLDASDREASAEEYTETFDRLRMYMLVAGPYVAGEPGLDEEERTWVTTRIGDLWAKPLRAAGDPATLSNIEAVAKTYVEMLAERPELLFERDGKLVERVQKILKRSDRSKAVTDALVASVDGPTLRLRDMVGVSSIRNQDRVVRPAFTRKVYEEQVKPRLEGNLDDLLDEQWVLGRLGEDGDRLRSEEVEAIKTEYFRRYIIEWRTFIDSIYIEAPDDLVDALGLLSDLTRTEPFRDLFSHVAYHTQLVDLDAKAEKDPDAAFKDAAGRLVKQKALAKLQPGRLGLNQQVLTTGARSAAKRVLTGDTRGLVLTDLDVTYSFLGLAEFGAHKPAPPQADPSAPPPAPEKVPLDDYQEQIAFVRDALQDRLDDPSESEKLMGRLKTARSKVKSLLAAQDEGGWQPTLEKLMWPPIDILWSLGVKDGNAGVTGKWCSDVVSEFERNLGRHYPFNPTGHDVAMSDFKGFFHPESGKLWQFYKAVLEKDILLSGVRFEVTDRGASATTTYRESLITYLDAAFEISTVMFPAGADETKVEFDVLIQGAPNVKEISFTVDGDTYRYRNGPEEWHSMTWPGEGNKGARIEAKGFGVLAELEQEGEWGLFRVLEQGTVRASPDQRAFAVQFDFREEGAGLVQMKIRPKRADNPFFGLGGNRRFMTMFRTKHLQVPRSIVASGASCSSRDAGD